MVAPLGHQTGADEAEREAPQLYRSSILVIADSRVELTISELFRMQKLLRYIPYSPASRFEANSPAISIAYQDYVKTNLRTAQPIQITACTLSSYKPIPTIRANPPARERRVHHGLTHELLKLCLFSFLVPRSLPKQRFGHGGSYFLPCSSSANAWAALSRRKGRSVTSSRKSRFSETSILMSSSSRWAATTASPSLQPRR